MGEKLNRLSIYGTDNITMDNPKTTMAGFSWTGSELRHVSGRTMRFTPEMTDAISAAVAAAKPAIFEHKTGDQIVDGDREGWEFSWVEGDAIGHYTRQVQAQVTTHVSFGKEDLR